MQTVAQYRPALRLGLPFLLFLTAVIFLQGYLARPSTASASNSTNWFYEVHSKGTAAAALGDSLVMDSNAWFLSSGFCAECHGSDTAGLAMVTSTGVDVNFTDDWRATMMANSARDPFWKAQVSHEGIIDPGHKDLLEDECTSCHAPLGRYSHHFLNPTQEYTLADLASDPLGQDGVTCMACHSLSGSNLGSTFSGQFTLDTQRVAYGPFPGAFANPMVDSIDVFPAYGPHMLDAQACASCHTLITQTVDLQGNFTGNSFVEQATYHEWVNSVYNTAGLASCQTCHVPQLNEQILISAHYPGILNGRSPYGQHQLVGANSFMLKLMQGNIDSLGLTADSIHFDSVIARTDRMLKQQSIDLSLTRGFRTLDSVDFFVNIQNKAGHKFPTGYPSRRVFVEFVVRDINLDTLFSSGILGNDYELIDQSQPYEPHHAVINQPGQVQIYEMVMGDVNGDVTTTLRRASAPLKDNRILPRGFDTFHSNYDTVKIVGLPNAENDYNSGGYEITNYRIGLNGYTDSLLVTARVWYQTVRPGWLDETFANNSPEIDQFRDMYNAADKTPVLIAEESQYQFAVGRDNPTPIDIQLWPNPSPDGNVFLKMGEPRLVKSIKVYDLSGRLLKNQMATGQDLYLLEIGNVSGVYMVEVDTEIGKWTHRVVVR